MKKLTEALICIGIAFLIAAIVRGQLDRIERRNSNSRVVYMTNMHLLLTTDGTNMIHNLQVEPGFRMDGTVVWRFKEEALKKDEEGKK